MAEVSAPRKKIEVNVEKVHVWPYLVRIEFLCAIITILLLTVWSITIDAPLEEAANPTKTPNPSKALGAGPSKLMPILVKPLP